MLGRAVNLYFITKYKNISTRKPKYCRAAMRIKEFILYGLIEYIPVCDDEHTPQLWQYFAFSKSFLPQLLQNILNFSIYKQIGIERNVVK